MKQVMLWYDWLKGNCMQNKPQLVFSPWSACSLCCWVMLLKVTETWNTVKMLFKAWKKFPSFLIYLRFIPWILLCGIQLYQWFAKRVDTCSMLSYKDLSCAVQMLSTIKAIKNGSLRQKHFKNICRPIKSLSVPLFPEYLGTSAPQNL